MSFVTTELKGHVLLIGLNRPEKRNAFTSSMISELADAYEKLEENDQIRSGVLFAHGEHFTTGLDLGEIAPKIMQGASFIKDDKIDPWGIYSKKKRTKPVVVVVNGMCLTLGIELALAGDIIVASREAQFAQIEIKRGIYAFAGASIRMTERVGRGNAMRYLLTGDTYSAETAYRIGMVQEITETGEALAKATEIAETIAKQAPLGVRQIMITADMAATQSVPKGIAEHFLQSIRELMMSEDGQEGFKSFIERREAVFKGR
ncbi:MAG: crotonase/enoyl-CoA hydratase family protein [Bacteroidota bacterium]